MAISITDKSKCCGCASCVSACPRHSLSLTADYKGFRYPVLDTDSCIDCGKCERICPIRNLSYGAEVNEAYAAWTKLPNPKSTSGGLAYQISKGFILNGGVVYGCASVLGQVRHIRVDSPDAVTDICGSKYTQSDISSVYEQIDDDLDHGKPVLFTGVPCQVYAVKSHFKNRLQNLYLMDILCHGVPSQQMLDEHIASFSKGRTVESISFRNGDEYCLSVSGKGWNRKARFLRDSYIAGFLNSITLRESCIDCQFTGDKRYSDITLGDFWGLGAMEAIDFNAPSKISLVMPTSAKGHELISFSHDQIEMHERPVQEAINGNYPLRGPAQRNARYRLFSMLYRVLPFGQAVTLSILDIYMKKPFQMLKRRLCKRK